MGDDAPYAAPRAATARRLILLDGLPGAGKTTTQHWLQPALAAEHLSMASFAAARGVSAEDRHACQRATAAPHPVDEAFLSALAQSPSRHLLVEKFARTPLEAAALVRAARANGWRLDVLHLQLPDAAASVARQLARGAHHGHAPGLAFAAHRAQAHLERATPAREALRSAGVPIHAIDATRPPEAVRAAVRRALELEPEALGWHRAPLEVLAAVSERLGIEAWVANGSVYRPFWNDRFGPAQQPADVDVAVNEAREVPELLRELERVAPRERWSVQAPSERLRARWGIETRTAAEARAYATFLHRTALVRVREGRFELHLPAGAEGVLWSGVLALNPRRDFRADETHHLRRALRDYPGLQVEPRTAELLGAREYRPKVIVSGFRALKAAVVEARRVGRSAAAFCRRALSEEERGIARQILRLHREGRLKAEAPPLPARARRVTGSFEELAREAADAELGAWLLDQLRETPDGAPDADLKAVLELSVLERKLKTLNREQSAMHQGWPVERHLCHSLLQLQTDGLVERLKPSHGAGWSSDLRLSMRVAMLFHDTGKLLGERPKRHAEISAKLFKRFRPSWFPERLLPVTQWLIRTHDLFGVFGRGLTEPSYPGALDAQAVRARLRETSLPLEEAAAINRELWRADIGAIAALRCLLPVAELVERLLLVRSEPRSRAPTLNAQTSRTDSSRPR